MTHSYDGIYNAVQDRTRHLIPYTRTTISLQRLVRKQVPTTANGTTSVRFSVSLHISIILQFKCCRCYIVVLTLNDNVLLLYTTNSCEISIHVNSILIIHTLYHI